MTRRKGPVPLAVPGAEFSEFFGPNYLGDTLKRFDLKLLHNSRKPALLTNATYFDVT